MPVPSGSTKKFHLALGVEDMSLSIQEYTKRLGQSPQIVIPGEYALWRTDTLNVSIRKVPSSEAGHLRHLGWELEDSPSFSSDIDCNHIPWEYFSATQQEAEIKKSWPDYDSFSSS